MPALRLLLSLALACPTQTLACDGPMPRFDGSPEGGVSVSVGRIADRMWEPRLIDGTPVAAGEGMYLLVSFEGPVEGMGGCNRFAAEAEMDAGSLEFGQLIATEKACLDPTRTEREAAFLKALSEVRGFVVSPEGLWLTREDGSVAVCLG
ncbi:MAG: META domain-containing protein [Tabrizicola sp.]|jgi:putative lipoprotein|nr:META domain-containing protein [Tabrizicola sp.]